jgi:hypothetical protein
VPGAPGAPGAPQLGGPSPKQARLSTEGSDNEDDDSNSLNQQSGGQTGHHPNANSTMISKQNQSTPSPASSSPPSQLAPSPSANSTAQQQQQSIANTVHNMQPLPSLSPALTAAQLMTGYGQQHTFTANFAHPAATGTANYNQAHAHQGNMAPNSTSYLPTGAGGAYSQLQGPYQWN